MNRTPLQLLIVEDEAAHVEAIRRAFDQASFKADIQAVGTLREYRERTAAQPPDLALVDLNLPDGRATEVLTHPAVNAPFPIVVMSAFGSQQIVVEVMRSGALDYIVKSPEAFDALPQAVTRALREWQLLQNLKKGEVALRARENSYATLVKNISGAVYRCRNDANWTVDFISDGCFDITGYRADELTDNRVTSLGALMHPDDAAAVWVKCQANLAAHRARSNEFRLTHRNGETRWVWNQAQGIFSESGELLSIEGLLTDITERKQAEAALGASEAEAQDAARRQTAILNALPAHIALIDPEGVILSINEAWRRFATANFLQSVDCCVGWNYLSVCEKATGECSNEAHEVVLGLSEVLAGRKQEFAIEYPCHAPTEKRWFRLMVTPLHGDRREGAVVMHINVTERKRAEAAMRESEERFRAIFEQAAVGVAQVAPDGRWLNVNQRLCEIVGYTREELLTGTFQNITHPDDLEADLEFVRRMLVGEITTYAMEKRYRRKDGSLVWIHLTVSLVREPSGAPQYFISGVQDISQRKRAEAEAERQRAELQNILDAVPALIFYKDREGRFLRVNRALADALGVPQEAFVGKTDADFGSPHSDAHSADDQKVLTSGTPILQREEQIRTLSGDCWLLTDKIPYCDETGGVAGIIGLSVDITDRKQAEKAEKIGAERTRFAAEAANLGIWNWNLVTGELVWSDKCKALFGVPLDSTMSYERFLHALHPDDRERTKALVKQALDQREPYEIEYRSLWPDGSLHWLAAKGRGYYDAAGKAERMEGVVLDVTERKELEEAHTRLAMAVEQSVEAIIITDPTGVITYVNPAFEKSSGYTRAEALGQNPRLLKSGKQDAEFYRRLWEQLGRGEAWSGHFINKRKDGKLYEEEATIAPIRDPSGAIINYVAVQHDVTREKQLEAQFRQSQKMESIGQLAGGVAHDFNNILAAMMMEGELALMVENTPEAARDGLRRMQKAIRRAANLTRQLLLFSRKQVMQTIQLDLNEAVTSLTKMLQRIVRENVQLQLHLNSAPVMIFTDEGMLDQILMNLVVNAGDAMPMGGKLVIETAEKVIDEEQAAQDPEASPGRFACLSVSDTGCGMTPEIQSRIFEPFFTTKEAGQGTGLGLATVFGIVKQHHGWIKVYSEPGQGTTFQVFLPASSAPAGDLAKEAPERKPRGGAETILVVEDDADMRGLTRVVLERNGYSVLEAANGGEAKRVWLEGQERICLLLTDIIMPELGGRELAAHLREQRPELKVVFMSGYSPEMAGQALQLQPGQRFLQKPCPSDQLLETVRNCLDQSDG